MIDLLLMLTAGTLIGGAAGYVGSLMVTHRMSLVGDALGHVALPGIGLALLLNINISLGAMAFLLVGILLIWQLRAGTPLPHDTLVGIVFVTSLAIGFLVVPEPDLLESLIGDISKLTYGGFVIAVAVSVSVILLVRRIYPGMMLLNISEDLAAVQGLSIAKYNFLYLLSIALIVALGVRITGTLLVGALVIIPPATARLVSHNLAQYAIRSAAIGAASCITGTLVFRATAFPAGPAIILVNALLFSAVFARGRLRS